mmetsp:Transcript_3786/g.14370  ORF Transcript_3786/g.14370 Transcript_3786/m.14370 type:complete len:103 (+) Transcript_3786:1673-1981(+)
MSDGEGIRCEFSIAMECAPTTLKRASVWLSWLITLRFSFTQLVVVCEGAEIILYVFQQNHSMGNFNWLAQHVPFCTDSPLFGIGPYRLPNCIPTNIPYQRLR